MRFWKYHGIGNDFVMFADPEDRVKLTADMARALCDRRFGIGGDGAIRVAPGTQGGDFVMDYINSDGSPSEMCGNGIRCVAIFARDQGLTTKDVLDIETGAGPKRVEVVGPSLVRVDMGPPIFRPSEVPVRWEGEDALHAKIDLGSNMIEASILSMGNPHAVLFVENEPVDSLPFGPTIEKHKMFPNGTNVEFAKVESPDRVRMRVWERGSGETLACGTGACAVAVAAKLVAGAAARTTIALQGGELQIEWDGTLEKEAPVYMTGPVVRVFEGDVDLEAVMGGRN